MFESLGFNFVISQGHRTKRWDDFFSDLVEFKAKYGHCNIPAEYGPNPALASWVKRQREQYRSWKEKLRLPPAKKAHLEAHFKKLKELGFKFHYTPSKQLLMEQIKMKKEMDDLVEAKKKEREEIAVTAYQELRKKMKNEMDVLVEAKKAREEIAATALALGVDAGKRQLFKHFLLFGANEGQQPCQSQAATLAPLPRCDIIVTAQDFSARQGFQSNLDGKNETYGPLNMMTTGRAVRDVRTLTIPDRICKSVSPSTSSSATHGSQRALPVALIIIALAKAKGLIAVPQLPLSSSGPGMVSSALTIFTNFPLS